MKTATTCKKFNTMIKSNTNRFKIFYDLYYNPYNFTSHNAVINETKEPKDYCASTIASSFHSKNWIYQKCKRETIQVYNQPIQKIQIIKNNELLVSGMYMDYLVYDMNTMKVSCSVKSTARDTNFEYIASDNAIYIQDYSHSIRIYNYQNQSFHEQIIPAFDRVKFINNKTILGVLNNDIHIYSLEQNKTM